MRRSPRPKVAPRIVEGGIYAKRDEKTYCAKGCQLGIFGRTVHYGESPLKGDLILSKGMDLGATHCPFCDAPTVAAPGVYFFKA